MKCLDCEHALTAVNGNQKKWIKILDDDDKEKTLILTTNLTRCEKFGDLTRVVVDCELYSKKT